MQHFLDAVNRVLVSSDAPRSADQEAREENRQIRQSPDKIALVVDDEPLMRWAICEHLRQNNFSAMEAATAADGYEQVLNLRERVSVLITDMVIPGGGGWQLVQRARRVVPDLAVIFISGTIGEQVVASATSHSRTGFLEKPFELNQLTNLLNTLLSKGSGKKSNYETRREIERDQKAG
jgi:two-component system, cell cycle sensor histidine kinase and response regulator CckA